MPNGGGSKMGEDGFSEKGEGKEVKNPKKGENLAKEVSKGKREDFRQEVARKKKNRRRRPRKKKGPVEQKEALPVARDVPAQDESALPTPEYEERFKEDEDFLEGEAEEPVEAMVVEDEQMPINPFEAAEPPVSTIEKKALEDKPLDRKDQKFEKEEFESGEKATPEIIEQAVEEVDQVAEQMGEEGAANEAEAVDVAEKAKEQAVVAEVVETKPELESEQKPELESELESEQKPEQPLEGVVQPAETEKSSEIEHDIEEFKEDLWDILSQAGITKKKIIIILLIIVFGVLFIWFGGIKLIGLGGDGDDVSVKVLSGEILPGATGEGSAYGIVSSYVFGLEFEVPKTPIQAVPIGKSGTLAGVDTALYFGEGESDFENRFVYYIDLLRKMDSMYRTDVYALIDLAVDRRAALTEHVNELNSIIQEGDNVYFEIQSRLESFDKEFEELAVDRDELEAQFFAATEELMPRSANDYLESFIEVQHDANELKAYYGAYRTVLEFYIIYLDLLEPRYQDIVVNTEALIKGIRVFDVPTSDIDAILPFGGELE